MIKAVVYTSETGHSQEYAALLGNKTGLPVYEGREAAGALPEGTEILYIGWLMAGKIVGFKKADKRFTVCAVCAVGMSGSDSQLDDIKKVNKLAPSLSVFYLQGGFELDKLHGLYRFMMKAMKKTVGKSLAQKETRTPEEEDMLDLLVNGGNRVSEENLSAVTDWLNRRDI